MNAWLITCLVIFAASVAISVWHHRRRRDSDSLRAWLTISLLVGTGVAAFRAGMREIAAHHAGQAAEGDRRIKEVNEDNQRTATEQRLAEEKRQSLANQYLHNHWLVTKEQKERFKTLVSEGLKHPHPDNARIRVRTDRAGFYGSPVLAQVLLGSLADAAAKTAGAMPGEEPGQFTPRTGRGVEIEGNFIERHEGDPLTPAVSAIIAAFNEQGIPWELSERRDGKSRGWTRILAGSQGAVPRTGRQPHNLYPER